MRWPPFCDRSKRERRYPFFGRVVKLYLRPERGQILRVRFLPIAVVGAIISAMQSSRKVATRQLEAFARLKAWSEAAHPTQGQIEKIFGTSKCSYGLQQMRWRGLVKAVIHIHGTAIAYNLRRSLNILAVAA